MQKMHARITAVFCALVLLMTGMIFQIYRINVSDYIAAASQVQGKYRVTAATTRGAIYDRDRRPLVNNSYRYVASVLPTPEAAAALLRDIDDERRAALLERLTDGLPFALPLGDANLYARGIDVFRVAQRYSETQYAPHLIGYLGDGGIGVAGIEKAYDEALTEMGGEISVLYQMDALGRMMDDTAVAVERSGEDPVAGVVLTLDRRIQEAAQEALASGCERGGVVVMDVASGEILAMASVPVFDQNNVAESLARDDAPFVNRAVSGYSIGSVFKLLVSAAALESGVSRHFTHECAGYIDVEGQVFRCNNNAVHGVCDMARALEVSCNSYFISLARQVAPDTLLALAGNMGLASSVELAPGIHTSPGNLPELAELQSPAGYANFSFGQGSSLASPLQMAQAVSVIAGGGLSVTPRLVLGTTTDGANLLDKTPAYAGNRVLSEQTAEIMRALMVGVVEEGSGKTARPAIGSAGGKTSSAQTGVYLDSSDGQSKEIVHAWFAGFYPASEPRYAIVVFVEGGESGERAAAPIFKQIADAISRLR